MHADIKPDNFLVLASPGLTAAPALQLIDFGKAVDLTLVTDDKENIDTAKQEEKPVKVEPDEDDEDLDEDEKEEREIERNEAEVEAAQERMFTELGRAGQFHLDYYGIAGCAYCLLFGKYIEVGTVKNRWVVKGVFQRRWQTKLWLQFFDVMLNPGRELSTLPDLLAWRSRLLDTLAGEAELREGLQRAAEVIETGRQQGLATTPARQPGTPGRGGTPRGRGRGTPRTSRKGGVGADSTPGTPVLSATPATATPVRSVTPLPTIPEASEVSNGLSAAAQPTTAPSLFLLATPGLPAASLADTPLSDRSSLSNGSS